MLCNAHTRVHCAKFQGAALPNVEPQFHGVLVKYLLLNIDFKSELKIGLSTVGIICLVCWILGNVQSCLYGNKVADFFEINPITLMSCYCPETKNYRTSNKHPGFQ